MHRDLKPANVLINNDGLLKIVDFGVAAAQKEGDTQLTKTGYVIGSPKYMAPEQILGKKVDERADIYSVGVIMYEMITGVPPYSRGDHMSVMYQHVQGKAKTAIEVNPQLPRPLSDLVTKAMSVDKTKRYQSMDEMRDGAGKGAGLDGFSTAYDDFGGHLQSPPTAAGQNLSGGDLPLHGRLPPATGPQFLCMARIDAFLKLGTDQGCSDIHFAVGLPPMLRMHGDLLPIKFRDLSQSELEGYIVEIMNRGHQDQLRRGHDVDFSYVSGNGGRFRVNVFRKETGVGATFRAIPSDVPTIDRLGAAAHRQEAVRQPPGHDPGHRLHRHGQVDHAGRDDRLPQLDAPAEHHQPGRPDRVRAQEQASQSHSARVEYAPARRFSEGVRAAMREDPDVILVGELRDADTIRWAMTGRRNRPPGARHAAHDRRGEDHRPYRRRAAGRRARAEARRSCRNRP